MGYIVNLLLLGTFGWVATRAVYNLFFSDLVTIPGPFWARLTRFWKLYHQVKGDMHLVEIQLHSRYGALVRIAPNEVSVSDAEASRKIYGAGSKYLKSKFYIPFAPPGVSSLFTERNEEIHTADRRLVSPIYSMTSIARLENMVDVCLLQFFESFETAAKNRERLNMSKFMNIFALETITQIFFTSNFGFIKNGDSERLIESLRNYWVYCTLMSCFPEFHAVVIIAIMILRPSLFGVDRLTESHKANDKFLGKPGLLAGLLHIQNDKPGILTDDKLEVMAISTIGAGADSTGSTLAAIIYYVSKNPTVKKKLLNEIDEHDHKGRLPNCFTYAEAQRMPFLQAVIKETMRMHPAVGFTLPRIVPDKGDELAGRTFRVGVNAWVIHRDREIFGPDADEFRPERWLDLERAKQMDRHILTFGNGSRICVGKNISLLEISKVIPTLFRGFEVELCEPEASWVLDNKWFVQVRNMDCFIKHRMPT